MQSKKKIIIAVVLIVVLVAAIGSVFIVNSCQQPDQQIESDQVALPVALNHAKDLYENPFPDCVYRQEGYNNLLSWWHDLKANRLEYEGKSEQIIADLNDFLTEEQKTCLCEYESNILNALSFAEINDNAALIDEIVSIATAERDNATCQYCGVLYCYGDCQQQYNNYSYGYSNGNGNQYGQLTKSGGVNYYNGRKETWYSSNVLYHYRTPEWTAGADGVYRDSEGYVVVAASDLPQGATVDTSYGVGKVYDSGCAAGVTDIYVNW